MAVMCSACFEREAEVFGWEEFYNTYGKPLFEEKYYAGAFCNKCADEIAAAASSPEWKEIIRIAMDTKFRDDNK
jgi:hypothetical protein